MKCKECSGLKRAVLFAAAVLACAVAAYAAWRLWRFDAGQMRRSAVVVVCEEWNSVDVDGKALFYFSAFAGDTAVAGITQCRDSAVHRHYAEGVWVDRCFARPSCDGLVASVMPQGCREAKLPDSAALYAMCRDAVVRRFKTLRGRKAELDYYLCAHGVQDAEYHLIASLATAVRRDYNDVVGVGVKLEDAGPGARLSVVTHRSYTVVCHDSVGRVQRLACQQVAADRRLRLVLFQTVGGVLPTSAKPVALMPWNAFAADNIMAVGFGGIGEIGMECDTVMPQLVPGTTGNRQRHGIPQALAADGSPVFTAKGRFVGMLAGDSIIGRRQLGRFVKKGVLK